MGGQPFWVLCGSDADFCCEAVSVVFFIATAILNDVRVLATFLINY